MTAYVQIPCSQGLMAGKNLDMELMHAQVLIPVVVMGVRRFNALYRYDTTIKSMAFIKYCHPSGRAFKFKPSEKRALKKIEWEEKILLQSHSLKFGLEKEAGISVKRIIK